MAGTAFLFLNGSYQSDDRALVTRLMRDTRPRPLVVAVDGGLSFLQRCDLRPDVWLTDLDSAPRIKKGFINRTEMLLFSPRKDKTDAELALDLCLRKRIARVTIFGWYDRTNETDHLLGNVLLCQGRALAGSRMKMRFLDSRQEIIPLRNESLTIQGGRGRRLSVVPLTAGIRLTARGVDYPARNLLVHAGQTIALRNRIVADRAVITVAGTALAIIGR
ncbi:MAG: thiamine diphosphokinase [candidate division Zixibacteria bacterium]|nr:thiamine diphosphokinase [candidate division Zixibacteria bacterium]